MTPITRLDHCFMVGSVMQYVAKEFYGMEEEEANNMFLLGYIHDCMYDFEGQEHLHNEIVSSYVGDAYKAAVRNHSEVTEEVRSGKLSSIALDLLYLADQIVDGQGKVCSFEDRIEDILERHGTEDGVYQDTVEIVDYLRDKQFGSISEDVFEQDLFFPFEIPTEQLCEIYDKAVEENLTGSASEFFYRYMENSKELFTELGISPASLSDVLDRNPEEMIQEITATYYNEIEQEEK